jgi:hypothetical protein
VPYNPGSAYPRKTTYVNPVHPNGMGINQAVNVNKPLMSHSAGTIAAARSTLGLMDARAAAAAQTQHSAAPAAAAALSRRTAVGDMAARLHEQQGLRQNQGGLSMGQSNFSSLSDRPDALPPRGMIGSTPQVNNPVARERQSAAETSMDKVVDTVLQSPSIGVVKPTLDIPKWETGRRR